MAEKGSFWYGAKDMARDQAEEARQRGPAFQASAPGFERQAYGSHLQSAQTQQRQAAQQQQSLADAVAQRARGEGPSLAEMMLQRQTQQNTARVAGMLASQRGLNPAIAARQAAMSGAAMQQAAAGQGTMLRAQEQQQAQTLLGQLLAQQRGQDLQSYGIAGSLAGQQAALGVQSSLDAQRINAAMAQAAMADQRLRDQLAIDAKFKDEQRWWDLAGAALGTAGTLAVGLGGGGGGGGGAAAPVAAAFGGRIEPQRSAPIPGDHPANDTVPALLSPSEIVVPRSEARDPDRAAEFVRAIHALEARRNGPASYGEVLARRRPARTSAGMRELDQIISRGGTK